MVVLEIRVYKGLSFYVKFECDKLLVLKVKDICMVFFCIVIKIYKCFVIL